MKIIKRTLVYLTTNTQAWIEPIENNCVYLEMLTRIGEQKIDAQISAQKFPKVLLEFQLKKMADKIGIPFLNGCVVGRWGFKKALKLTNL